MSRIIRHAQSPIHILITKKTIQREKLNQKPEREHKWKWIKGKNNKRERAILSCIILKQNSRPASKNPFVYNCLHRFAISTSITFQRRIGWNLLWNVWHKLSSLQRVLEYPNLALRVRALKTHNGLRGIRRHFYRVSHWFGSVFSTLWQCIYPFFYNIMEVILFLSRVVKWFYFRRH